MKVYRLEDRDDNTIGAYDVRLTGSTDTVGLVLTKYQCGVYHPLPSYDRLMGERWRDLECHDLTSPYHFGTETVDGLQSWFFAADKYDYVEAKSNIVVSVYEVDEEHVIKGDRQCAFILSEATLIEQHPITVLNALHRISLLRQALDEMSPEQLRSELNETLPTGPTVSEYLC